MAAGGTIYFIACAETQRVKIGFTTGNPAYRLKTLQTGSPTELILMATEPGTLQFERELHEMYAQDHIRGEWFTASQAILAHMVILTLLNAKQAANLGAVAEPHVRAALGALAEMGPLPAGYEALV